MPDSWSGAGPRPRSAARKASTADTSRCGLDPGQLDPPRDGLQPVGEVRACAPRRPRARRGRAAATRRVRRAAVSGSQRPSDRDLDVLGLARRAGRARRWRRRPSGCGLKPALNAIGTPARRSARSKRALEVAVAREPQPTALGVAQPQPLDGRRDVADRCRRAIRRAPARAAAPRRRRPTHETARSVAARWVRSGSRCPSGRRRRSRSTASSGSPRPRPRSSASCQSSQSHSLSRPLSRWSQGSTSVCSRSRVVYQSRSTGWSASAAAPRPSQPLEREVLAPAVEARAVAPHLLDDRADPAVAAGEQSFDDARLAVVVAEADGLAVLACPRGSRRAACAAARRWSRGRAAPAHWNGVCGLGTNPPIDTVQRMSRVPLDLRVRPR